MVRGPFGVASVAALVLCAHVARAAMPPALVPAPAHLSVSCATDGLGLDRALRFPRRVDAGGFLLVRERWTALGFAAPRRVAARADVVLERTWPRVTATHEPGDERYALTVTARRVTIRSRSAEGEFDALATLAQLAARAGARGRLPCVAIDDRPALRWRIVSDDISRGPFPTARYLRERIRTLASLKINGWSPYMEQVYADPAHPYVATPNRLTPRELHAVTVYARRYHVTVIPEQQTFAHMHESLKYETLAGLAELPHGYLLSPSDPRTYRYLGALVRSELAAADRPPFFHIGADEPIDLGAGRTPRTPHVFAAHVNRLAAIVHAGGARPMIWDDALQQTPAILDLIPRDTAIVSFHYGAEASFAKYLAPVAAKGFTQFVAPGDWNWNEIYPDLTTAYANEAQFIADGKAAHVAGMFETVWHDDGESLYEATWPGVGFAAASAWQRAPVDRTTWHAAFARAFFGSDDPAYARDLDALQAIRTALRTTPESDPGNYLFWSDPFDAQINARLATLDIRGVRLRAEAVLAHLLREAPPLHANAAAVMRLAAWRYDALGRRVQIGGEARRAYATALAHVAARADSPVERNLNVAKYLCWELRDELSAIAPMFARAWRYESTEPGLDRVLVRYASAQAAAMADADRLNRAERESYVRSGTLPSFDTVLGRTP